MGKQARVALFGEQRRNIVVEDGATEGAVVGGNLVWSDGTVVTEADIRNSLVTTSNVTVSSGGVITTPTAWALIVGIPSIIGSLGTLTDDGWIRNDSGTLSASKWPYVPNSVAAGETCTIPSGSQLLVVEGFDVIGTADIAGTLAILA